MDFDLKGQWKHQGKKIKVNKEGNTPCISNARLLDTFSPAF